MRLWLIPCADLSLHDQIVRQISLGVLSGELAPGERLPSVRAVAHRFHIHPNTVSSAYRELAADRWVESRHGSGVYVRNTAVRKIAVRNVVAVPHAGQIAPVGIAPDGTAEDELESLLWRLARLMRQRRMSPQEIADSLTRCARAQQHVLLVEPDVELARIVQFEIEAATGFQLAHLALDPLDFPAELVCRAKEATVAVLPSKAEAARAAAGNALPVLPLRIRPIAGSLAAALPAGRDYLVAIVSRWPQFGEIASDLLQAAGFSKDALLCVSPRSAGWRAGLETAAAVLMDSATALEVRPGLPRIVFPLIAEESFADIRSIAPGFPSAPLTRESCDT